MKFQDSSVVLQDLADAFGKRLSEAEIKSWHRRVFEYMAADVAVKTVDRIVTEPSRDGKPKFFPSISHFLEVSRSIKSGSNGPRLVEYEPGVWLPLDEVLAAQEQEKREWDRTPFTEEQRRLNLQKLDEIFAEHFGRRGSYLL